MWYRSPEVLLVALPNTASHKLGFSPSNGSLPRKFSGLPMGTAPTYWAVADREMSTSFTNRPAK